MKKFSVLLVLMGVAALSTSALADDTTWSTSSGVLTLTDAGANLTPQIAASLALDPGRVVAVYEKPGAYALASGCIASVMFGQDGSPIEATIKLSLPEFVAKDAKAPNGSVQLIMQLAILSTAQTSNSRFSHVLATAFYADVNGNVLADPLEASATRRVVTNHNLVAQLQDMAKVGPFCKKLGINLALVDGANEKFSEI